MVDDKKIVDVIRAINSAISTLMQMKAKGEIDEGTFYRILDEITHIQRVVLEML